MRTETALQAEAAERMQRELCYGILKLARCTPASGALAAFSSQAYTYLIGARRPPRRPTVAASLPDG